ncbi:bifunctional methylenetetrahydrofolate dehydrogenase/methenyltetrahydrofolate cyclohydrolase FolD [Lentibacillus sp. CBA3610]|uniref:bifunctional methylenetetrahydrofolate dehydrogenase/methenyltetrahydrofolate cyclohydrolase FolD n=1 Tax=Lentibacillus sp. CBA3610 TaxID=2518176 RepID=UPI001595504E|nr:bifunctional methylenetetrahydrofolate dehydrogenase/methenyltetrahydrofolate cyclohydrolase FolD [Lentibacillus sp. CBA3610]QKY69295.1 bifunctional methylenetetrahydrofolate dehydrogenase/methenyltetrahydrofolate cyclohydrolase FolD [Lentibacillus sp. CBA3610]
MPATVIDGKELGQTLRGDMTKEVSQLKEQGITPHLTVIIVGDDPASKSYVNGKKKATAQTGIASDVIEMPSSTSEAELLEKINDLNHEESVHGILVQLPLPDHINEQTVIETISPHKDVDGFHPINIGNMMAGNDTFLPCTPYGIIKMLHSYGIQIKGKHAVVIGRSNIVGKPVGQLLLNEHATVTYCHSRTHNLTDFTTSADILIAAVGKPNVIRAEHIKQGAAIIDVGINRQDDGSLTGDVDFASAAEKASYITPVPKGVGPMTITMLLQNTIKAAKGLSRFGR